MNKLILGAAILAMSAPTYAASTSTATNSSAPKLIDKFKLTYDLAFIGPAVTAPLNSVQPNVDTGADDNGTPIVLKNYLTLGYKLNNDMTIKGTLYFKKFARERNFTLSDPYVKLTHGNVFGNKTVNVYGEIKLTPPVTSSTRDGGGLGSVGLTLIPSYSIPNSKFSLSFVGGVTGYMLKSENLTGDTIELYAGPQIDYQIRKNVSLFVLYEQDVRRARTPDTDAGLLGFRGNFSDLEPGVSWDITPRINFTPLLNISTGNKIALDTTQFLMNFTWKLL